MITRIKELLTAKDSRARAWTTIALVLIILLGAFFRFYQLGAAGYGNDYYAAAVKSVLTSWHNFFFVSYEPGGSVSVDKPPLGFWLEAFSALIFGINGFALALPNALAGVFSIILLFFLIKKPFGRVPALIAALALACVPITIATERNNTIDGMLVFMLLLAVWAFIKAVEKPKIGYLILGAVFVGLAFNIKMLQAFMVLPALYLFYLFGAKYKWWRRFVNLGVASVVLIAVSLSWALIVDAVPASQRPFVGSSTNNSVMELIFGHNGIERLTNKTGTLTNNNPTGAAADLEGPGGGPGGGLLMNNSELPGAPESGGPGGMPGGQDQESPTQGKTPPEGEAPSGGPGGQGASGDSSDNGENPPQQSDGSAPGQPGGRMGQSMGQGMGMNDTGSAGIVRLFIEPLATQASWLLPLSLLGALLFTVLQRKLAASKDQKLAVLLWAAWLIPCMVYFSFTRGLWHTYYLIMLGPAIAALAGIAFWSFNQLRLKSSFASKVIVTLISSVTVAFEIYAVDAYPTYFNFFAILLAASWLIAVLIYWIRPKKWSLVLVFMVMLIAPFLWSGLTALNVSADENLPQAEPISSLSDIGKTITTRSDTQQQNLIDYLLSNTKEGTYLLATLSSRDASSFILATSRPVLTFGGFTGSDSVINAEELAKMVSSGKLRYVLDNGELESKSKIYTWVKENCTVVQLSDTQTTASSTQPGQGGGGSFSNNSTLYDCQKSN
jgi:4-amino-4-deoxy-L-arabinose transferase-like glycosyltransferase